MRLAELTLRSEAHPDDVPWVRQAARATGFFSEEEVLVAGEVVEEKLAKGAASGYEVLFAAGDEAETAGFACYGRIPLTVSSYDLYWILVLPEHQARGLGKALLAEVERRVREVGGTRLYVDTSSRPQYQPTRVFYDRCGYAEVARLDDFYTPGDGKVIHCKLL